MSTYIKKVNSKKKVQSRILVLTTYHVLNIELSTNILEKLLVNPIKRKIKIELIEKVVISKIGEMFVLKVKGEYDYLLMSEHRTNILTRLLT